MHFPFLDTTSAASGGALGLSSIILLGVAVFEIVALWRIFTKAGRPGWLALIPIVNLVILCHIGGLSAWWLLILLIPGIDVVFILIFSLLIYWNVGRAFGKGAGFNLGLALLTGIFMPILAFGEATYNPALLRRI